MDKRYKVKIFNESFPEEIVWDAVLKVSEKTAGFFWPYSDLSEFIKRKTPEEEQMVYDYLKSLKTKY